MFVHFVAAHPILALGTVAFGVYNRSMVAFALSFGLLALALS